MDHRVHFAEESVELLDLEMECSALLNRPMVEVAILENVCLRGLKSREKEAVACEN